MADDPTWGGLARGGLVLAAIWWAWVGYAWLTNVINPEEGVARLVVFLAMAGMLVVALAIPGAFGEDALLFALAYAVVRGAHIALYAYGSPDRNMLRSVFLLGRSATRNTGTLSRRRVAAAAVLVALGRSRPRSPRSPRSRRPPWSSSRSSPTRRSASPRRASRSATTAAPRRPASLAA